MYLEDKLKELDTKMNVLIAIDAYTQIPETDITLQEHCGNHIVKNWLNAIEYGNLKETFQIKDIENKDETQIKITLDNKEKDELAYKLDKLGNDMAVQDRIIYPLLFSSNIVSNEKLTDKEFNVLSKYTANIKLDEVLDVDTIDGRDVIVDYEEGGFYDLSEGIPMIMEAVAYPFMHDDLDEEEAAILAGIFEKYGDASKEDIEFYLSEDEKEM